VVALARRKPGVGSAVSYEVFQSFKLAGSGG
jgi:hypothetical protein